MSMCIYEDCDQDAHYCVGHAIELVDPLGKVRHADTLRVALEHINDLACYASEENTEAREAALLEIGKHARAALAKVGV